MSRARFSAIFNLPDLRWLAGYLANLGRQREQSSLPPADASLSELAGRLASEVARLADVLQRAVA